MMTFDEYLSQPCDDPECDRAATHNGFGRNAGQRGKWCNDHTDWHQPAHARND